MSAMHLAIPAVVGASSNVILPVSTPMVMMHEIARVPFWRLVRCSRMTAGNEYEKQEKTNRKKTSEGDGKQFVTQDLVSSYSSFSPITEPECQQTFRKWSRAVVPDYVLKSTPGGKQSKLLPGALRSSSKFVVACRSR